MVLNKDLHIAVPDRPRFFQRPSWCTLFIYLSFDLHILFTATAVAAGLFPGGSSILSQFPCCSDEPITIHITRRPEGRRRPVDWTRSLFFNNRLNSDSAALQERRPRVVDVPFARGKRVCPAFFLSFSRRSTLYITQRNASAREIRLKWEKEKNAKKASAGSSCPQIGATAQISCFHDSITQYCPCSSHHTCRGNFFRGYNVDDPAPWHNDTTGWSFDPFMATFPRSSYVALCTSTEYTDGRH